MIVFKQYAVTDGEFRRSWWEAGEHTAKFTIPSPSMLHFRGEIDPAVYPDEEVFFRRSARNGWSRKKYLETINKAVADRPDDFKITMHICRGNFRSTWISSGGYEPVAKEIFQLCLSPQCGFASTGLTSHDSIFNMLAGFAPNATFFIIMRFIASMGMGGLMPVVISLMTEYSPKKNRAMTVAVMYCGYSIGAVERKGSTTVAFWIMVFSCLMMIYGLNTWLPAIMQESGFGIASSLSFVMILAVGQIVGSLTGGYLVDRIVYRRYTEPCQSIHQFILSC